MRAGLAGKPGDIVYMHGKPSEVRSNLSCVFSLSLTPLDLITAVQPPIFRLHQAACMFVTSHVCSKSNLCFFLCVFGSQRASVLRRSFEIREILPHRTALPRLMKEGRSPRVLYPTGRHCQSKTSVRLKRAVVLSFDSRESRRCSSEAKYKDGSTFET